MGADHALERIVIVPVNGYANRLQAWASAAIMGAELDVPVQVLWEPEAVAAAPAAALFAPQRLRMSFISPQDVISILGVRHQDMPRYLTLDREQGFIFLAGHDRGEQAFMPDLAEALADTSAPSTLVIVAGGTFSLPGTEDAALQRRRAFYQQMDWHPTISQRVDALLEGRGPFIGLHVRGTDRSRQAPTPRALSGAIDRLATTMSVRDVYVAADSERARDEWVSRVTSLGLRPWTGGDIDFDRSEGLAGVDAMVDWIVLGRSQAIAFSAESSFGYEAAVAAGKLPGSRPLSASAGLQWFRGAQVIASSVATFPARRLRARQAQ